MIGAFGHSMIHKWNLGRETAKRDAAERVDLAVASLDEWWYELTYTPLQPQPKPGTAEYRNAREDAEWMGISPSLVTGFSVSGDTTQ